MFTFRSSFHFWCNVLIFQCYFVQFHFGAERNFFSLKFCQEEVADCSFQIGKKENVCTVIKGCADFNFDDWITQPVSHPSSEADAMVHVSVLPYQGMYIPEQGMPMSATNISLDIVTREINGIRLSISKNKSAKPSICRIFDFRKAVLSYQQEKFSLFYDCLNSYILLGLNVSSLSITAFPMNEELRYLMSVPNQREIEPDNLCVWRPVILIYEPNLDNNIVSVWFSEAPQFHDVQGYEVSIIHETGTVKDSLIMRSESKGEALHVQFDEVDIGYYRILIRPLSSRDSCDGIKSVLFFVSSELKTAAVGYIAGLLVLGVILTAAGFAVTHWIFKRRNQQPVPKVLLVYPHFPPCHGAIAQCLQMVLEKFNWKVFSIYGTGDSSKWLSDKYLESTSVVMLFSSRSSYDIDRMMYGHPWGNRLPAALECINCDISGYCKTPVKRRKLAKVFFKYSERKKIPSFVKLSSFGKSFEFPEDINNLLLFLYNEKLKLSCLGPCNSTSKSITSLCEGDELLLRIKHAQDEIQNSVDVCSDVQSDCKKCADACIYERRFLWHSCFKCDRMLADQTGQPIESRV